METKKKIILCPNPYRDKDMRVAAQSKAILEEVGFETVVCLPFQKEGYGTDLGVPIFQLTHEIKKADLLIAFGAGSGSGVGSSTGGISGTSGSFSPLPRRTKNSTTPRAITTAAILHIPAVFLYHGFFLCNLFIRLNSP